MAATATPASTETTTRRRPSRSKAARAAAQAEKDAAARTPGDPTPGATKPSTLTAAPETEPETGTDGETKVETTAPATTPDVEGKPADDTLAPATGDPKPATAAAPAKPAGDKTPKAPKPRRVPGGCACGCGETVVRSVATFVRGHDSILAKELRAGYANGDLTADRVLEIAGTISDKFVGKLTKSIAAVDAEREATTRASEARLAMLDRAGRQAPVYDTPAQAEAAKADADAETDQA